MVPRNRPFVGLLHPVAVSFSSQHSSFLGDALSFRNEELSEKNVLHLYRSTRLFEEAEKATR